MSAFVLSVKVKIKPDCVEQFMTALLANAKATRETEPGCLQYDVLVDPEDRTNVMFYEVYKNADAFEAHQQTPHFKRYMDTALGWLESRGRQFYRRVAP